MGPAVRIAVVACIAVAGLALTACGGPSDEEIDDSREQFVQGFEELGASEEQTECVRTYAEENISDDDLTVEGDESNEDVLDALVEEHGDAVKAECFSGAGATGATGAEGETE